MRTPAEEERILGAIEERLVPLYRAELIGSGHDVSHIRRMLKIAERIVSEDVELFLLKVAIWLHNLDRAKLTEKEIPQFISKLLSDLNTFSQEEISLIIDAVEKHSLLNDHADSPLLCDLKDADRLDSGAKTIMSSTSYRHKLPFYLPGDFDEGLDLSGDEKKVIKSCVQDFRRVLEWEEMLRNPRAKEFGKKRFAHLRRYLADLEKELRELDEV